MGSSASLYYAWYISKSRYSQNIRFSLPLQQKIERGKIIFLKIATNIQRVLKIWKMRNLTYTRRENRYFQEQLGYQELFASFTTAAPIDIENDLEKYKRFFSGKTLLLR